MTRPDRRLVVCAWLLAAAILAGCAPQAAAPTPTPIPPTATPAPSPTPPGPAALAEGLAVDIGGRRLFIQCSGTAGAGPTVLLEAGLAGDHTGWAQVHPAIAREARVCSYDRAGLGASDPAPTPRDGAAVAADLEALLAAAAIPGPYLLVGHSFGALYARIFAERNPEDVAGLVLVDPVHEDWWQRALQTLPPPADGDSERLRSFRQFLTSDLADPARNAEGVDIPATAEQARATAGLGDRPLIVLSAGVFDVVAPGLPPAVEAELRALFQETLPQELAALSSDSTVVQVPDSGHNIPAQRPDMVVLATQAVLAALAP